MSAQPRRLQAARPFPPDGYVLLPVVLALTLLAAIALALNQSSALLGRQVDGDGEQAQARYLAEAGINHALWQANASSCSAYPPVSGTLDGHSYSATLSPASGSPVDLVAVGQTSGGAQRELRRTRQRIYQAPLTLSLQLGDDPGRDMMLDSFYSNANWGGSSAFAVSANPAITRHALLYFDLSALPNNAEIRSARLELFNSSQSGSAPYPAIEALRLTRDWSEGTGIGTGNPNGATWYTHDGTTPWTSPGGDVDAPVLASAAMDGSSNLWRSWDLTGLVAGWVSGAYPNFGLLLRSSAGSNSFTFLSQENSDAARRPRLIIEHVCECGSGSLYSEALLPASQGDTYLDDGSPSTWLGANDEIRLSNKTNIQKRGLLQFDLSSLPSGGTITSATLALNLEGIGSEAPTSVSVHRVTRAWDGGAATWSAAGPGTPWTSPGGDFDPTPSATSSVDHLQPGTTYWNITALAAGWLDGSLPNHGLLLQSGADSNHVDFTTSNHADSSLHPRLTVTVSCPCGVVCTSTPPPRIPLLLVSAGNQVFDPASGSWHLDPTPGELTRIALFESWNYAVNLIHETASQAEFDQAFTANAVAYIPATTRVANLGDKPASAPIGLVNEEVEMAQNLGFAAAFIMKSNSGINVTDNGHYITAPFALGALTLYTLNQPAHMLNTPYAPDLRTLGQSANVGSGYKPSLAVLDSGDSLVNGGFSAGRRVQLPWGQDGFNFNTLTPDGVLLLERALTWAADLLPAPPPPGSGPLPASADTSILEDATDNFGTQGLRLGRTGGQGNKLHSLLHFNLSGIPSGALINSATLRLYASARTGSTPFSIDLHRVTQDWTELGATWNEAASPVPWSQGPGGSYAPLPVASLPATAGGWYEWNLTPLVQEWVDAISPNQGVILLSTDVAKSNLLDFDSREMGNPPQLVIDFTAP